MSQLGLALEVIGVPYAVLVGNTYSLLAWFWRKRFKCHYEDIATCALPMLTYVALEQVHDRQGLYIGHALGIMVVVVSALLPLKGIWPRRRVLAAAIIASVGSVAAGLAWGLLPSSEGWFMNAPGVW